MGRREPNRCPRKTELAVNILCSLLFCVGAAGSLPNLDGFASSNVEKDPLVVVERIESTGIPPPQSGRPVREEVTELPQTAPITRVVEPQSVTKKIKKSNSTKIKGLTRMEGLEEEIQVIGWTQPKRKYLGIGNTMTVEFLWTITRIDFNSTTALEMIYLDQRVCKLRQAKFSNLRRCIYMQSCKIGDHDVRTSLILTEKGNYQIHYTVSEGDKAWQAEDNKGLMFSCVFVEGVHNFTLVKGLGVGVLATKPKGSKATVIKPEYKKKVIVGDAVTIEAELDRDGLHIVPDYCRVNTEPEIKAIDLGRGLYTIDYVVKAGNPDRPQGQLPFHCTFEDDGGNNVTIGPLKLNSWFVINANPPELSHVAVLSPRQKTARIGAVIKVVIMTKRRLQGLSIGQKCTLNAIDVRKSANVSSGRVTIELNVTAGQADWFAGKLPIDCLILDSDGNTIRATHFTDGNMLSGDAHTPRLSDYFPGLVLTVGFAIVCISSNQVAAYFPSVGMPLITGYLATGIIAGPEILGLIPDRSIRQLRFIDEVSLAVIALTAGQKLYLPTMRSRLKSIGWVMLGLVLFEYAIGTATIFAMHPYIHFMKHMDSNQITAVALMAGALVCARSPASAVAIVKEVGAEGPFTSTVLGVTVISDVVVIGLFALTSLFSNSLLANRSESQNVVYIFIAQIIASSLLGYILSAALRGVLKAFDNIQTKMDQNGYGKAVPVALRSGLVTFFGFSTFVIAHMVDPYLQPLIVCMVSGFIIANYSGHRKSLKKSLELVTPTVYVAFFTLAGAALNLKSLAQTIVISSVIFGGRIVGILFGASFGGWMSGEPVKENGLSWMAYITQAGVTLGLAKKIHLENRVWGGGFATVIIACVVLNQVSGPPLFRLVMQWVGEAGSMERSASKIRWPKTVPGRPDARLNKRVLLLGEKNASIVSDIQSLLVEGRRAHSRVVSGVEVLAILRTLNPSVYDEIVASVDENNTGEDIETEPLLADQNGLRVEREALFELMAGSDAIVVAMGSCSGKIATFLTSHEHRKRAQPSLFYLKDHSTALELTDNVKSYLLGKKLV
jgi:Kef-type K+ transport system membrane component KefB